MSGSRDREPASGLGEEVLGPFDRKAGHARHPRLDGGVHPPTQGGRISHLDRENDNLLRNRKEQFPGHAEGFEKSDIVGGAARRGQKISLAHDKKCANWRGGGLHAVHDDQTSDILSVQNFLQEVKSRSPGFAENDLSQGMGSQFPRHRAPESVVGQQLIPQAQHANRLVQGFPF